MIEYMLAQTVGSGEGKVPSCILVAWSAGTKGTKSILGAETVGSAVILGHNATIQREEGQVSCAVVVPIPSNGVECKAAITILHSREM